MMNCPICNTKLEESAEECFVCWYRFGNRQEHTDNRAGGSRILCPVCRTPVLQGDSVCPLCGVAITKKESDTEALAEKEPVQQVSVQNTTGGRMKIAAALAVALLAVAGLAVFMVYRAGRAESGKDMDAETDIEQMQDEFADGGVGIGSDIETESEEFTEPIEEETEEPVEEETDEPLEEETEEEETKLICIDDYCGAWNIGSSMDRELVISKITDDVVSFSLYYYRLDYIENVVASLEKNIAYFSTGSGVYAIEGALIFDDNSVIVQIAKSERDYMPAEKMVFDEWHDQSWESTQYDFDGTASVQYIEITSPLVYIYSGPGYEYGIVGSITDMRTYRIVETADVSVGEDVITWGRLLSGVGWINIYEATDEYMEQAPVYILPNSSTVLLTYEDIRSLSKEQLRLARNEIYARHGRKFDDDEIRSYFESQWWYHGVIEAEDFTEEMLSETERMNAAFILTYE